MTERLDQNSEQYLIKRAKEGDSRAFGRLFEAYLDPIYRYIYFRVSDVDEAEEMTDDVFVKAWEALPNFTIKQGKSLLPWLYRIAHNLVVDHYRRRTLHEETEPLFAVRETLPSVEEMVGTKQAVARAVQAVHRLDQLEQSVLLLRFVEQLPYREIAEIVGKSEGACRVIQYRALSTLRDLLEEEKADA